MTHPADLAFRELANEESAVARLHLSHPAAPNDLQSLVARDERGRPTAVRVLDRDGDVEVDKAAELLALARNRALVLAEQSTEHLIALLTTRPDADVNLAKLARTGGFSRTTLYARLEAAREAARVAA